MPSIPDYTQYDLNQLYRVLYHGDLDAFPEHLAAIKRQIELKGGDPNIEFSDDGKTTANHKLLRWLLKFVRASFTRGEQYNALIALKIVRWVVGLIYGSVGLILVAITMSSLFTLDFGAFLINGIPSLLFAFICWLGVALMRVALRDVRDKAAVEMGWLSALGLAPLSGICYMVMSYLALMNFNVRYLLIAGTVFLPLGFYMPFILLTYWLKYKYRNDEF